MTAQEQGAITTTLLLNPALTNPPGSTLICSPVPVGGIDPTGTDANTSLPVELLAVSLRADLQGSEA